MSFTADQFVQNFRYGMRLHIYKIQIFGSTPLPEPFTFHIKATNVPVQDLGQVDIEAPFGSITYPGDNGSWGEWQTNVIVDNDQGFKRYIETYREKIQNTGSVWGSADVNAIFNNAFVTLLNKDGSPGGQWQIKSIWPKNDIQIDLSWESKNSIYEMDVQWAVNDVKRII